MADPTASAGSAPPEQCEFCGDQGPLLLRARCHLTAPLAITLDGNTLIVSCYVPECGKEVARFQVPRSAAASPALPTLLKRIVIAWDSDDSLDFLAAMRAARKVLGLKLADEKEDAEDVAVLKANGYTADGEPK